VATVVATEVATEAATGVATEVATGTGAVTGMDPRATDVVPMSMTRALSLRWEPEPRKLPHALCQNDTATT
jgi:hypothetical protein